MLSLLALWPAWLYLARRAGDGSDEPLGMLALAALLLAGSRPLVAGPRPLSRPALAAYTAALLTLPPLLQAAVALLALFARTPATTALCLLSLPSLASLQFYGGYPLRVLVAEGALRMLASLGFAVQREGVALRWGGHLVSVDPPCSGLRMLWMALFLVALLAWRREWGWRTTAQRGLEALALTVLANAVRVAALFLVAVWHLPAWLHEPVGGVCFLFPALLLGRPDRASIRPRMYPKSVDHDPPKPGSSGRTRVERCCVAPSQPALCLLVAALGFLPHPQPAPPGACPPWPTTLDGTELRWEAPADVPPGFPGRAALFRTGTAGVLVRQVTRPTRLLHASADCLRAQGLTPQQDGPRYQAGDWDIEERLVDADGRRFDDVSVWYWAAQLGRTRGPWTALTIARPRR